MLVMELFLMLLLQISGHPRKEATPTYVDFDKWTLFNMVSYGFLAVALATLFSDVTAVLKAVETASQYVLENDRLHVAVDKSSGQVVDIVLDDQDMLGSAGKGPYVDCSCVPSGFWTPGGTAQFELYTGEDSTGTLYGGVRMEDTYSSTNQTIAQWWFLREGETGIHLFTRVAYYNAATPYLRGLGELRTLFRPSTDLWTHLSSSDGNYAHIVSEEAFSKGTTVQDATTFVGNSTDDPYVEEYSDYFTKVKDVLAICSLCSLAFSLIILLVYIRGDVAGPHRAWPVFRWEYQFRRQHIWRMAGSQYP